MFSAFGSNRPNTTKCALKRPYPQNVDEKTCFFYPSHIKPLEMTKFSEILKNYYPSSNDLIHKVNMNFYEALAPMFIKMFSIDCLK